MHFALNGISVQSPQVMLETCTRNGFDTRDWLGKANCFVDRRGAEPSYGYFLVDHSIIFEAEKINDTEGSVPGQGDVTFSASNKVTLKITFDEYESGPNNTTVAKTRTIENLYTESYINITPSWDGEDSYYLLKVVDARFVFTTPEASTDGRFRTDIREWFNKVDAFLTPAELKAQYDLVEEPDDGHFIYDYDTVIPNDQSIPDTITIGPSEDGPIVHIEKPLSWEQLFDKVLALFTGSIGFTQTLPSVSVFPYFEDREHEYELTIDPEVEFPDFAPQNISSRYISADVLLRRLLFWTNTSLIYEGNGKFRIIPIQNKQLVVSNRQTTELDEFLSTLGAPSDIEYVNQGVSACTHIPNQLIGNMRLLDYERTNNEKEEYDTIIVDVLSSGTGTTKVGARVVEILLPNTHSAERDYDTGGTAKVEERLQTLSDHYNAIWQSKQTSFFAHFPPVNNIYTGFLDIAVGPYIERVSVYDLGNGPETKIESILPIHDWTWIEPPAIIPREDKLSVILAKVNGVDEPDAPTLKKFKDPIVLIGDGPYTGDHFVNIFEQNYADNELIILIKSNTSNWRAKAYIGDADPNDDYWFPLSILPYIRLRVLKEDITVSAGVWSCLLSDVQVVNGKVINELLYDSEEPLKITIATAPGAELGDGDNTWVYLTYDATAGSDDLSRWSIADAYNIRLLLRGISGHPISPSEKKYLSSDGGTLEWSTVEGGSSGGDFEQDVINIIEEYLEDNPQGTTGSVTILRALVNKAGGVAGSELTLNWDGATVIVAPGAIADSGTADNDYAFPFVDNEPILVIRKSNGMYSAIKLNKNIVTGTINAQDGIGIERSTAEFDINGLSARMGHAPPTGIGVAKSLGIEYAHGDLWVFEQTNDNKWLPIRCITPSTSLFKTTTAISQASWNGTVLTIGTGTARHLVMKPGDPTRYELGDSKNIKSMATVSTANNKVLQCKRIGMHWFIDVEECGN